MEEMKQLVNEVIENHTFVEEPIRGNMYLEQDLGMDSLKRTQVVTELESTFGIEFSIDDLQPGNFLKVESIYQLMERYVS